MRKIYIMLFMLLVGGALHGQTKKAYVNAAADALDNKNYYAALTYLSEALEFDEKDPLILWEAAEAARKFNAYDLAAKHYDVLVNELQNDEYSEAVFRLGEMQQRLGKYDEAEKYFTMYSTEYGGVDSLLDIQVDKYVDELAWAQTQEVDKSAEVALMENDVNTEFSEFGAMQRGAKTFYTSMQHSEVGDAHYPQRNVSKIHLVEDDVTRMLTDSLNMSDKLVAHSTFSQDGSMMYFTICEYVNADDIRCDIYRSTVENDTVFGKPELLPFNIDTITTTQPYLAYNASEGTEILYFVSDRVGGKGGLDIYSVELEGKGFGVLINHSVNTDQDDITPFYHSKTDMLYFSSNGRQGYGGFDIYSAEAFGRDFENINVLKAPVNSSYNDVYYTLDEAQENALFSSNREGSTYVDPFRKACCYDIYTTKYYDVIIDLNAITFDDFTKGPLHGVTVHLTDALTGEILESLTPLDDNNHEFVLRRDREYILIAEREHYNKVTVPVSTKDISESTKLIEEIYMTTDKMQVELYTFNNRTKEELEGVTIKIVDIDNPDNVIYLETNELNNKFKPYLDVGKRYKVTAEKFGFVTEEIIIDLVNKAPGLIKEDIYLDVFDIEDYLPVSVYFANDHPDPRNKTTYTDVVYGEHYEDYIREKASFIKKVVKRNKKNNRDLVQQEMDAFFEGDVAGGYETMKRFMRALKKELSLGRSLEIAIKGYASPLADKKYNLALGQRRVQSVKNEILAYEGGIFKPYIESGQLILTDISFGEELAPKDVSDNKSDQVGSIYGVRPSLQRRVELVSIKDQ